MPAGCSIYWNTVLERCVMKRATICITILIHLYLTISIFIWMIPRYTKYMNVSALRYNLTAINFNPCYLPLNNSYFPLSALMLTVLLLHHPSLNPLVPTWNCLLRRPSPCHGKVTHNLARACGIL